MAEAAYPSHPIHLIVGFTPGSAADITARAFGNGAEDILGQKIIVEDKPGAGSKVAAEYVKHAAADGYTLFLATLSIVTDQAMRPDPAFNLLSDFAPIAPESTWYASPIRAARRQSATSWPAALPCSSRRPPP